MSPEVKPRRWSFGRDRAGRFAAVLVGAVAASMVWLVAVVSTATTPDEARDRRAGADLPPPTVTVEETVLRQASAHDCVRKVATTGVSAPATPAGYLPVVTGVAKAGSAVTTGTELAQVAGQPLVAIVTNAVLYRDLAIGDRGRDVRGFEGALADAGVTTSADGVMDAATVAAWRTRFDPSGPRDRIRVTHVVPVGKDTRVGSVMVAVGDRVRAGTKLLEVVSGSPAFTCEVPDPPPGLGPDDVVLTIRGKAVEVKSVVTRSGRGGAESVDVQPSRRVTAEQGRLEIVFSDTGKAVLAVPLGALTTGADGEPVVVVVDGPSREEIPVELGVSAQGLIEVAGTGLDAGDKVELFDPADAPPAGGAV